MIKMGKHILSSLEKLSLRSKEDRELAQALTRMFMASLALVYLIFFQPEPYKNSAPYSILLVLYTFYSAINLQSVLAHQGAYIARRILSIFVDMFVISLSIYAGDVNALFLYPIYLWVIVANGVRYGIKYLYAALAMSVLMFPLATFSNANWEAHHDLIYSLSIGLVLLAFFFHKIILNLHYLNESLDKEVQQRTADLEHELYHDRLTGLQNRYALERDMKAHFSCILLIDIDKFHHLNELYGVDVGNQALKQFSTFLEQFSKEHGYKAYRVYGDGFILYHQDKILSHENIFADITTFLERLSQHKIPLTIEDGLVNIELSATIAISLEKAYALEKANIALKHARMEQKDFLAYFHAMNTEKELKDTLYWNKEIKEALIEKRMVPFFQPIVNDQGEVLKYEVLTRLKQTGINGVEYISPFHFLDIAIKTKQYRYITEMMIEKSFDIMQDKEVDFSINLLFSDIKNRDTMQYLKEQIIRYDIGKRLVLEIVESEDIKDYKLLKSVIGRFRDLGVRIAIDDFGSGFSNYAYILEIAPDYLKIDGSLIKEIDSDANAHKLVSSIRTLAFSLGIKTIAEYIHSREVFEVCKALKIDEYQGFYFSPPIDEEALNQQETSTLTLNTV